MGSPRKETIGDCELWLGDCRGILPTLGKVDAIVTDPPYGIGFSHGGNDRSGIGKGRYATKFAGAEIAGDAAPFDPAHLLELSEIIVLWGANHFANHLSSSSAWLIWDKRAASQHSNDFADCEMAWTSRHGVTRVFRHQWDGMMKASERGVPRVHPTQKPVALMEWCIATAAPEAQTIVDPYFGSGSTAVAAVRLGRRFIGIEIEPKYSDIAYRRIEDAVSRPDLFIKRPVPAEPLELPLTTEAA